tara:strand:+ start:579 stop:731 length:153 start_codon:yes stop_codon:yes gene_type:complete
MASTKDWDKYFADHVIILGPDDVVIGMKDKIKSALENNFSVDQTTAKKEK